MLNVHRAQLFAGVPLPPDFAEALQRAEHDYGGQANLVAAAQQMAQMLEHMTGSGEGGGGGSGTHNNSGVDSGSDGQCGGGGGGRVKVRSAAAAGIPCASSTARFTD
eukprot:1158888-Pelagomonas_calceolata.AAC.3